ncbi:MAG: hypothetical protein ACRELB_05465 [Polyangiaceae bacterium]
MPAAPLRLLVYDGTSKPGERLLRTAWSRGARLYRGLRRIDAHHGAASWSDALDWLTSFGSAEPIAEIQVWSHGKWGLALIGDDALTARAFDRGHALRPRMDALRARMLPRGASLVWFRTCETFGAEAGRRFAERVAGELDARVAGHTYVIGALQSGLHGLVPGATAHWPVSEGLASGSPAAPERALVSSPSAPHTIHFMNGRVPEEWFRS